MPTLLGKIDFTVKVDLVDNVLRLNITSDLDSSDNANLKAFFRIKQPDCITRTGNIINPDVQWNENEETLPEFVIPLRMASDSHHQRGYYFITLFAECESFEPASVNHDFLFNFEIPEEIIERDFDCFLPSLSCSDKTNYFVPGFAVTEHLKDWEASCPLGTIVGTALSLDLTLGGNYYDSVYTILHKKVITYQSIMNTWLSVIIGGITEFHEAAFIPDSMTLMLSYLQAMRDQGNDGCGCKCEADILKQVQLLYQEIRDKVCAHDTQGLGSLFHKFYQLTHNYQPRNYRNTDAVIPAYDFETGCTSNSAGIGAGSAIVVECSIGSPAVITGTNQPVNGLTAGSNIISCVDFAKKRVRVIRGNIPLPSIDPQDGSEHFTKILTAQSIQLFSNLTPGEYVRVETIP